MRTTRGGFLTLMAALIALAGVVDLVKILTRQPSGQTMMGMKMPPTGIVALGVRHGGPGSGFLGLLLAGILFIYAIGIWQMRRFALTLGWLYAAWVLVNVTLFPFRNRLPPTSGAIAFAIVYLVVAVSLTLTSAIVLTRRQADLH